MNMVSIEIYADSTGQYTDCECNYCNCVEIEIPKSIVKDWFNQEIYGSFFTILDDEEYQDDTEILFDTWLGYYYTCDDTDGLYQFAVEHGYTPICGKNCNGIVWYR